ncbi:MAG: ribonuclease HI [Bacteroidetes bacterium]|nr:ribonuclease HI [Bacteroidota bacterium]
MNNIVEIYTDGAASGNPGPGGYGVVMKYKGQRKEISQGFRLTTNNRMELMSVIVALNALKKEGLHVVVYSDSKYVVDAINLGWLNNWVKIGFKAKANVDLWKLMLAVLRKHYVKFVWVKGHASNVENNRCDELAVAASRSSNLLIDEGYEASQKNEKQR